MLSCKHIADTVPVYCNDCTDCNAYIIYLSTVSTHLHYLRYTDPDLHSTAVGCGAAAVADQGTASPQHLLYYIVSKMNFKAG